MSDERPKRLPLTQKWIMGNGCIVEMLAKSTWKVSRNIREYKWMDDKYRERVKNHMLTKMRIESGDAMFDFVTKNPGCTFATDEWHGYDPWGKDPEHDLGYFLLRRAVAYSVEAYPRPVPGWDIAEIWINQCNPDLPQLGDF